jgi:hypothetical protein
MKISEMLPADLPLTGAEEVELSVPDSPVLTRKATVQDIADLVSGAGYRGFFNCSANPNYPAASAGDWYIVSVAGKIGGASGIDVLRNDIFIATAANAGGTQAAVGASWDVVNNQDVDDHASFKVVRGSNMSLPNDAFTQVTFDTAIFDRTSAFDLVTNHRFTAAVAGDYQFNAAVRIQGASGITEGRLGFFKNGTLASQGNFNAVSGVDATPVGCDLIALAVGDYVDLRAYRFGGASANVIASQTHFSGYLARRA